MADCDAALVPRLGAARAASADGGVPDRLRWKLLLRRAEAYRGLGQPEVSPDTAMTQHVILL